MIGHYVNTLSPIAEDRLLTRHLVPMWLNDGKGGGCLIGQATDCPGRGIFVISDFGALDVAALVNRQLGRRFNELCCRFGTPRVTAAIRNRILSNRAHRVLGNALVCGVPAPQEPSK